MARHLVTFWRLLEAADADRKEVVRTVLHIDPDLGQCAPAKRSSAIWPPQNRWLTEITGAFFSAARPNGKFGYVEFEIENNVLAGGLNRASQTIGQRGGNGFVSQSARVHFFAQATREQALAR
ncbi:hypothetical protein GGD67_002909 [Bradyrhizobium sp. IAR9]|uniref:hypothetical protein n=1 Tax=Bradyrhizobium sp. IAR9 TaxID=2663841 RepID=UPI0015CE92D1|nr:hypothetical protein [Bradyrhizobium sp. IAR9]NYG45451.1 hypothetical protein [Bradyrhizobium sp. IAR9]